MTSLLGEQKKGRIFIVSAPAGTGKTTLVDMLVREFPRVIASVSYTTRAPRKNEEEGVHYHFISEKEFAEKIFAHDFIEYVKLYDTYYGTSRQWIEQQLQAEKHVVLVIDTQGAMQLREKIEATYLFIRPPSIEVLKKRLINRKTESQEAIEKRLLWTELELQEAKHYDYQIVNDDLMIAYQVLKSIVIAECHRTI